MYRIVVLISGNGTNLQNILDGIANGTLAGVKVVEVLSNRPNAFGLERAKAAGVPTCVLTTKSFPSREAFDAALLDELQRIAPDLIVLAGWMVILPERIVNAFENRILNIHPSLIPAFCGPGMYGLKVHEAVLAAGVPVSGATVHWVDCGTDTGPILLQKEVSVLPDDTPETLQKRIMREAEAVLLPQAIRELADRASLEKQDV